MLIPKRYKKRKNIMETVASDRTEPIPTMVYPQVDGITPTVVAVKKSFRDTWEQTE